MDWVSGPLKIGDWVELDSHLFCGFTGFIIDIDLDDDEYRVQITRNPQGKPSSGRLWIHEHKVNPSPNESLDFLDGLIDTTLLLNQKEWFMELTSTEVPYGNHPALTER